MNNENTTVSVKEKLKASQSKMDFLKDQQEIDIKILKDLVANIERRYEEMSELNVELVNIASSLDAEGCFAADEKTIFNKVDEKYEHYKKVCIDKGEEFKSRDDFKKIADAINSGVASVVEDIKSFDIDAAAKEAKRNISSAAQKLSETKTKLVEIWGKKPEPQADVPPATSEVSQPSEAPEQVKKDETNV